jgi:hypothetical protein
VGEVAVITPSVPGVLLDIDLGERRRAGDLQSMAVDAQWSRGRHLGNDDIGGLGVPRKGPVTGLATDRLVGASGARLENVVMARGARFVAGILERFGAVVGHRPRPEGAVDAEVLRDQDPAQEQERNDSDGEEPGHTYQVFAILEEVRHGTASGEDGAAAARVQGAIHVSRIDSSVYLSIYQIQFDVETDPPPEHCL